MPEVTNSQEELQVIRSELLDLDRADAGESTLRNRLSALLRDLAYTDILSADQQSRRLTRRLVHACLARLAPLQEASPARRAAGPTPSPDEEWLLAPHRWTDAELADALDMWTKMRDQRPNLVLLIPTRRLPPDQVSYPLGSDRSVRQIGVSAISTLAAPAVLVGAGPSGAAVAAAIRCASS